MTTLTQVPLQSDLVESLQEVAGEQGVSVENVLDEVVRQYLQQVRLSKIREESQHFEQLHSELKRLYYHQHVAIHQGQLVDHDSDLDELLKRVKAQFGRLPVLIAFVDEQPVPTFNVRRPQLVYSK